MRNRAHGMESVIGVDRVSPDSRSRSVRPAATGSRGVHYKLAIASIFVLATLLALRRGYSCMLQPIMQL